MPIRSCVACRSRRPAAQLLRLRLDEAGALRLDPSGRLPGRGAWLCPSKRCVQRVHPKALAHTLKKPAPKVDGLLDLVRAYILDLCRDHLRRCRKAGLVHDGPRRARELLESGQAVALIVASDASPTSLAPLSQAAGALIQVELELDRRQLGALLDRGPRIAAAIHSGRPAMLLVEQLQRRLALR